MSKFDEYANKYSQIRLERRNGILQMTLHTDGAPVRWGPIIQAELVEAFTQIGADRENRIIIMTGIGNEFSGPRAEPGYSFYREV
jgi:enoyl-CoA hydratase/carnithine racemase